MNNLLKVLDLLPHKPGVYQMRDSKGVVLYVGKANNLYKRVSQYLNPDNFRIKSLVSKVFDVDFIITQDNTESLILENNLIKDLKPKYNIQLKDDKSYPYIKITYDVDCPRIIKYRGIKTRGCYGPFPSASDTQKTISLLRKSFLLRSCTDSFFKNREKPCLEYQIKRCSAPCVNKISKEDYMSDINRAKDVLKGNISSVEKEILDKMYCFSKNMQYEMAIKYRDILRSLHNIHSNLNSDLVNSINGDAIGIYSDDNNAVIKVISRRTGDSISNYHVYVNNIDNVDNSNLLVNFLLQHYTANDAMPENIYIPFKLNKDVFLALRKQTESNVNISILDRTKDNIMNFVCQNAEEVLNRYNKTNHNFNMLIDLITEKVSTNDVIDTIEAYDNSHFTGKAAYGVKIVFDRFGLQKKMYRIYKFDDVENSDDDYFMMSTVIKRRVAKNDLNHKKFLLIDGGMGHLNMIKDILGDKCYYACISKGIDRNAGEETLHFPDGRNIKLPNDSKLLYFLQVIRDESHRFAITNHRNNLTKSMTKSSLDEIPGIGMKRKKALLLYFGTIDKIKAATIKQLTSVPYISKDIAIRIYNFFHIV